MNHNITDLGIPAESELRGIGMTTILSKTRDPQDTGDEESVQGYSHNVMNPACPATWEVITTLIETLVPLFPFAHLHLGGDELPPNSWSGSPLIKTLKDQKGLRTAEDVQGWTMHKAAQIAHKHGARSAAWNEAIRGVNGGIGNDAIIFCWTDQKAGIAAANAGYDVVMCPAQNVYLDMAYSANQDDWGPLGPVFSA